MSRATACTIQPRHGFMRRWRMVCLRAAWAIFDGSVAIRAVDNVNFWVLKTSTKAEWGHDLLNPNGKTMLSNHKAIFVAMVLTFHHLLYLLSNSCDTFVFTPDCFNAGVVNSRITAISDSRWFVYHLGELKRPHCDLTGTMVDNENHPQIGLKLSQGSELF